MSERHKFHDYSKTDMGGEILLEHCSSCFCFNKKTTSCDNDDKSEILFLKDKEDIININLILMSSGFSCEIFNDLGRDNSFPNIHIRKV